MEKGLPATHKKGPKKQLTVSTDESFGNILTASTFVDKTPLIKNNSVLSTNVDAFKRLMYNLLTKIQRRVYMRGLMHIPYLYKSSSQNWKFMRELCVSNGVQKREVMEIAIPCSLNLPV
jgi:uncharacterized radical SAM superfamily Fe-S cluster-containing enzyme